MADQTTVVHVTHETVGKVGGIGAVLAGFFTCDSYLNTVNRSIIAGPLFTFEGPIENRLGDDVEVLYSSADGLFKTNYAPAFRKIENLYNAAIIYGKRTFTDEQTGTKSSPEILLVDVRYIHKEVINEFKRQLFEAFGIRSDLHENLWEYEQYIRLAPVAIAALYLEAWPLHDLFILVVVIRRDQPIRKPAVFGRQFRFDLVDAPCARSRQAARGVGAARRALRPERLSVVPAWRA